MSHLHRSSPYLLAQDHTVLFASPEPKSIYLGSPGICVLDSGRIIVTDGLRGPGLSAWIRSQERQADVGADAGTVTESHESEEDAENPVWHGRVFLSDDGGATWNMSAGYRMRHQRPFAAGGKLYIIGHDNDLLIMRSDDDGESWGDPVPLTSGQFWHQAPSNVWYANGCVYLVMERRTSFDIDVWSPGEHAPVLMRGRVTDDLTDPENWTFASELSFREVIPGIESEPEIDWFGVPFFDCPYPSGAWVSEARIDRHCAPVGWLETNVVQFTDPEHLWCDPEGKTFHLWMRAHTGGTGYACIARVVEELPGKGAMRTELVTAPSGKRMLYVPCPGGQMKFHVIYDEVSRLYWLLSTQATDSMRRPDVLPEDRYNLPNNERRRLQLHFSRNMIDWCFAGMVAIGPTEIESRHYASMAIRGDDLLVTSRSASPMAKSPHDTDLSTFHVVRDFRKLIY